MPLLKAVHHRIVKIYFSGVKQLKYQREIVVGRHVAAMIEQRILHDKIPVATGDTLQILQHAIGIFTDACLFVKGSAGHRLYWRDLIANGVL